MITMTLEKGEVRESSQKREKKRKSFTNHGKGKKEKKETLTKHLKEKRGVEREG